MTPPGIFTKAVTSPTGATKATPSGMFTMAVSSPTGANKVTPPRTSTMAVTSCRGTTKATPPGISTNGTTPHGSRSSQIVGTTHVGQSNMERSGTQRKVLSPITSFLNVPLMRKNATGDTFSAARVLTSEQSFAMIEEKERKNRENEEAKERRKVEREEKRHIREVEKQRKSEERQRKAQEREEKKKLKQQKKPGPVKTMKSSSKVGESSGMSSGGLQSEEISSNECAVCLDAYQDDFDENGELVREWLQCTSQSCAKWMHQDCLREENDA